MIKFKEKRITEKEYSVVGDKIKDWTSEKGASAVVFGKDKIKKIKKFVGKQLDRSTRLDPEAADTKLSEELKNISAPSLVTRYIRHRKLPVSELALSQPILTLGIPAGYIFAGPVPGTTSAAILAQAGANGIENLVGKNITKDNNFDIVKKKAEIVRKGRKWAAKEIYGPLAGAFGYKDAQQYWNNIANGKHNEQRTTFQDIIESYPTVTENLMNRVSDAIGGIGAATPGTGFVNIIKDLPKNKKKNG